MDVSEDFTRSPPFHISSIFCWAHNGHAKARASVRLIAFFNLIAKVFYSIILCCDGISFP